MSRLDWFTILVVGICLAAIVFLLSKAMDWGSVGTDDVKSELQTDLEEAGLLTDDETIDPDNTEGEESENTEDNIASGEEGDSDDAENMGRKTDTDDTDGFTADDEDVPVNTSPSKTADVNGEFMVIGGSFSLLHNAENYVSKLKEQGYSNAAVAKFNSGKFASVIVDSFNSSAEASAMVKKLKADGIDSYVQRKKGSN